jgi:hypothetical protein
VYGLDDIKSESSKKKIWGINRNFVTFSFFFFLSFIFWYLNALSKVVEAEITYPVNLTNLPKDRTVEAEHPLKLDFYLKGQGYSLFRLKVLSRKTPMDIDISSVNVVKVPGGRNADYYILTSGLTRLLSLQLRSECEITSIKPDTLFFTIGKAIPEKESSGAGSGQGRKGNH